MPRARRCWMLYQSTETGSPHHWQRPRSRSMMSSLIFGGKPVTASPGDIRISAASRTRRDSSSIHACTRQAHLFRASVGSTSAHSSETASTPPFSRQSLPGGDDAPAGSPPRHFDGNRCAIFGPVAVVAVPGPAEPVTDPARRTAPRDPILESLPRIPDRCRTAAVAARAFNAVHRPPHPIDVPATHAA